MWNVPRKPGPYEIVAPLGKGGIGEGLRARDTRSGRRLPIEPVNEYRAGVVRRLA